MTKKISTLLALVICATMLLTLLCACDPGVYTVVYDGAYEGSVSRSTVLKKGETIPYYNATRSGYDLVGWYSDKTLSTPYNFENTANGNLTLYARWQKQPAKLQVTFDTMIEGEKPTVVTVEEGSTIDQKLIPACVRLGFNYSSWYTDEEQTEAWDFENYIVSEDTTLYASYTRDMSIERDANKNIVFNDVTVNMFAGWCFNTAGTLLVDLVNEFNKEYSGRIKVIIYTDKLSTTQQNSYALRYQQIPGANDDIQKNYYKASSLYDLIGVEFDKNDWFANAIRNCYVDGSLYSVPMVAGVPYLVYNKSLMDTYNPSGVMPKNYNEFATLLQKVYAGEVKRDPNFKSIITGINWPFREATSMAPYIQNDADYYVYEDGKYVNKWGDNQSPIYQKAIKANQNIYNLFGDGGNLNGGLSDDSFEDYLTLNKVVGSGGSDPSAFMGIINVSSTSTWMQIANEQIGVLPLSGLFAEEGSAQADQIPVHTLGFQFYKAKNVSVTELAAAAVFADWASKHSHSFAQKGWYPLNKAVTQADAFAHPYNDNYKTNEVICWVLKKIGNPENFRTLDGYSNEKLIVNTIGGEQYMATGGVLAMPKESITDATFADQIYKLQKDLLINLD